MSDLDTLPLARWSGVEHRPLVIGGPCSAESEAQVMETAARLQGARVDYFRAGIWKARTRPRASRESAMRRCHGCGAPGSSTACIPLPKSRPRRTSKRR